MSALSAMESSISIRADDALLSTQAVECRVEQRIETHREQVVAERSLVIMSWMQRQGANMLASRSSLQNDVGSAFSH